MRESDSLRRVVDLFAFAQPLSNMSVDITNKFLVAEFTDTDGTVFIEAFPSRWLKENFVYWPESAKLRKKRSIRDFEPDINDKVWVQCQVTSIKGVFDEYPDAAKLANQLELYSDTSDEASNTVKHSSHRQIFKNKPGHSTNYDELIKSAFNTNVSSTNTTGYEYVPVVDHSESNGSSVFFATPTDSESSTLYVNNHPSLINSEELVNDRVEMDTPNLQNETVPDSQVVLNLPPLVDVLKYINKNGENSQRKCSITLYVS